MNTKWKLVRESDGAIFDVRDVDALEAHEMVDLERINGNGIEFDTARWLGDDRWQSGRRGPDNEIIGDVYRVLNQGEE